MLFPNLRKRFVFIFIMILMLAACIRLPEDAYGSTPTVDVVITPSAKAIATSFSTPNINDHTIVISDWRFSITFPPEWDPEPYDHAQKPGVEMYKFWREGIIDNEGREIIPVVGLVFEEIPEKTDIVTYSAILRSRIPVEEKIDKVFTYKDGLITLEYAIGYQWRYVDRYGMEHTVYSVHAINGTTGMAVSLDATSEVFDEVQDEFLVILRSLEFVEQEQ